MESFHSVVVVGAGPAGLYAAQLLKTRFPDVVVLEAQNRVGGRIMQVDGMAPWSIEAGPEFIHGSNSILVELLKKWNVNMQEKFWPDWWFFGDERKLVKDDDVDDEIEKVHDLFGDCGELQHPPPGKDVSAEEYMRQNGYSRRQMAVAEACYANDFACSLRQLGLREMIEENRGWDSGETYLQMDRSMGFIIQQLRAGLDVRTNWPVEAITYDTQGGALLRCKDGRSVRCRKVLITVPHKVLQDCAITFNPPLPERKLTALRRVKMGNVVKIIVTFNRQFWRDDMYDVVCTDSFVPEFWMLKYPPTAPGTGSPHCVVGFVAGEKADAVSQMDPQEAINKFMDQLDTVFGKPGDERPASSSLREARVMDWSKEPYVRGAYTYPSYGAELGDRVALAAPVAGTLFFAGEATHESMNPCVQGALDTAKRAAAQIEACMPVSRL